MSFSFTKSEKVVSLKIIESLFSNKCEKVFLYPFKVSFIFLNEQFTQNQVLIIVPKRNFKKAVDRNRIKRQIRELYRLNKELLKPINHLNKHNIAISIAFVGKSKIDYKQMELPFQNILKLIVLNAEKSHRSANNLTH